MACNDIGAFTSQIDYYALAGHLIGSTNGTTTTYYLTDAQGSVLTALSASAIVGQQVYGPYGNTRYQVGSMGTTKGYTGQFHDAVSGLDYYNARYYDPVVGQFVSVDSVEGNLLGFDPYAYVGGNPETMSDPTGYCPWCIVLVAGIVAGAVGGAIGAVVADAVAGKAPTWQDVGKGALVGAATGLVFTGGALLLAAIPAVGAAGAAGAAASEGIAATLAAGASYLTANATRAVSTVVGSSIAAAVSSAGNSLFSAVANHWWPTDDPQSYEDGVHAQQTADAQHSPATQTATVKLANATATAEQKLDAFLKKPRKPDPRATEVATAQQRYKNSDPGYTFHAFIAELKIMGDETYGPKGNPVWQPAPILFGKNRFI